MTRAAHCLFCRIVAREVPGDVVAETERVVAFRDISPAAPVHVLVVPRDHHPTLAALAEADPGLLAEVLSEAGAVARQEGLDGGHRIVVNTGDDAGQTVAHLHVHVLGGRRLQWPPG